MIKERIFLLQKRTAKQENAVLSQVLQQKRYMQIIKSRKCQIFVINIDKTVGFYVTTSIKGHNQREAIHLPKRFQWVNISVQSVMGAQWLSGRVLDLRPKGSGFEPYRRHCVVVLEQDTFILA